MFKCRIDSTIWISSPNTLPAPQLYFPVCRLNWLGIQRALCIFIYLSPVSRLLYFCSHILWYIIQCKMDGRRFQGKTSDKNFNRKERWIISIKLTWGIYLFIYFLKNNTLPKRNLDLLNIYWFLCKELIRYC